MPISSNPDLDADMPPGSSSEKFLKPLSSGGPIRLEVKVEGVLDRSTMLAPLTQRPCVLHSASAMCSAELAPAAYSEKQADFIVSMVDAPGVKISVEGGNVVCFDMRNGLWRHSQYLVDAAA